jgi:hypothetical protein
MTANMPYWTVSAIAMSAEPSNDVAPMVIVCPDVGVLVNLAGPFILQLGDLHNTSEWFSKR